MDISMNISMDIHMDMSMDTHMEMPIKSKYHKNEIFIFSTLYSPKTSPK